MALDTIEVLIKKTGENFTVPVSPETTIEYIIKYVCEQSVMKSQIDYQHYYIILMNTQEMLDNDKTLKETPIFTVQYPVFQLRMKSNIREQILDAAIKNSKLNQFDEKDQPVDLNSTASSSDVNNSNQSISGKYKVNSYLQIRTYLIILEDTSVEPKLEENVNWRKVHSLSSTSNIQPNLTEKLADTYQHVTSKIFTVGTTITDDPKIHQNISKNYKEINIVLCGSARVGKSTLINAICQQNLALTSAGLDHCTSCMSRYTLQGLVEMDSEIIHYRYNFWDTPGFENWSKNKIRKELGSILEKPKSEILCLIYCASPGSYANLQQLRWILDECMGKQIFCALVCTNKWAGQRSQREAIMNDFQELLECYNDKTREENGVIYYGNMGLCTSVNSQQYVDEDSGKSVEESGVNELIFGIMESLDDDKILQWCMVVFENKSFWSSLSNLPKQLKSFWKRLVGRA